MKSPCFTTVLCLLSVVGFPRCVRDTQNLPAASPRNSSPDHLTLIHQKTETIYSVFQLCCIHCGVPDRRSTHLSVSIRRYMDAEAGKLYWQVVSGGNVKRDESEGIMGRDAGYKSLRKIWSIIGDAVETLGTNLSVNTEASWETLKRHQVRNLSTNTEASWETL